MFAGHVGAALAIGRAERRVNVGIFVTAALLLDLVLWVLILFGWETVILPTASSEIRQPGYLFPFSHGLIASLGWSALAGGATFLWLPSHGARKARVSVWAMRSSPEFPRPERSRYQEVRRSGY